jgi:hypothetical protein
MRQQRRHLRYYYQHNTPKNNQTQSQKWRKEESDSQLNFKANILRLSHHSKHADRADHLRMRIANISEAT